MQIINRILRPLGLQLTTLPKVVVQDTPKKTEPVDPWNSAKTGNPYPPDNQLVTVGMQNGSVYHKHYRPAYRSDGKWLDELGNEFQSLGYKVIAWKPIES